MSVQLVLCLLGFHPVNYVQGQRTGPTSCNCKYTPDNLNGACATALGEESDVIANMKSIIRTQQDHLARLAEGLQVLQRRVDQLDNTLAQSSTDDSVTYDTLGTGNLGTHYVRWGRTVCPDTASLIYEGHAAKSHYSHTGGGANYICLDKNPQWPDNATAAYQSGSYIYGVEYQTLTVLPSSLTENDAPCAVCHVSGRGEELMIPGTRTCPAEWTNEYEGILVSANSKHEKSSFVCLDAEPEAVAGQHRSTNGGLFYTVEATCTALPCPPFVNRYEVACVVCTL